MAKANKKSKESPQINYGAVADEIINTFYRKGIKTPMDTEIPCIYDNGYYDSTYATQKLKGLITVKLGYKATEFAVRQVLDFIKQLDKYLETIEFDEIYLLRNPSRKGIGFFETKNFYPDFILWIIKGDQQTITFIEPHGLIMTDYDDEKLTITANRRCLVLIV